MILNIYITVITLISNKWNNEKNDSFTHTR